MTTQNVAWPNTMVQTLNGIPAKLKADRSEIPVRIPGSAMGKIIRSEIDSRPKNLVRDIQLDRAVDVLKGILMFQARNEGATKIYTAGKN